MQMKTHSGPRVPGNLWFSLVFPNCLFVFPLLFLGFRNSGDLLARPYGRIPTPQKAAPAKTINFVWWLCFSFFQPHEHINKKPEIGKYNFKKCLVCFSYVFHSWFNKFVIFGPRFEHQCQKSSYVYVCMYCM